MKALIIIIFIGLLAGLLLALAWHDRGMAATPEPLQTPAGCSRQGVVYWTQEAGVTEYSMLHKKHNGKPVPGCGAVLKTNAGVWRENYELGEVCWPDACIKNYVIKGLNGQHDRYWTIVRALNSHVLTRLALWNQQ